MTLAARALDFGFRGHRVGHGVDLEFPAGEIVCLLGPNGSGKTTLLRTLLGLIAPLAGDVTLDGRSLEAWPGRERATRLAYVPQAAQSYFDFSVLEMVQMGRTAHRGVFAVPGERDRELALASLARLRIAALAERPIHRVSGGECQLALIARALASEARHLLMDEPTANLDFGNQALILDEVARLKASGAAVLFSTHHPDHALRIADRVVMLRDGKVLAAGHAGDTINSQNLSALYGRPIDVAEVVSPDGVRRRTCVARELPPMH
ncbi:MAG TPA: ABC transporter ATP-binding protein [Usitatibacter sp.]|nr:ABC transporter ATP-binding protein [Usitatibacter sp.]